MEELISTITDTTFISIEERARPVGLCAKITGNSNVAEDLAQEALLEAWRSEYALHDESKRRQWLSGIARNVCLRWQRKHGRDSAHLIPHPEPIGEEDTPADLKETLAGEQDIEVELERKELIELLDRARSSLSAETRTVLIQRYVEESPLAEIAALKAMNKGNFLPLSPSDKLKNRMEHNRQGTKCQYAIERGVPVIFLHRQAIG